VSPRHEPTMSGKQLPDKAMVCPQCERTNVVTRWQEQDFVYGPPGGGTTLTASVPVRSCSECGFEFLDEEAELARHAAICDHLGVLKPAEIRGLRERYKLSRAEFANVTRLGEATLARWENGILIQNKAYDEYLRLLDDPANIEKLTRRLSSATPNAQGVAYPAPRFRCVGNVDEHRGAQATFELRRSRAA